MERQWQFTEKPMIVWAGHGTGYPSETTMERTYRDGSKEYFCAFPECDFISEVRHAVRSHWGKHVRAGEVERVERPTTASEVVGNHPPAWHKRRRFVAEGDPANFQTEDKEPKDLVTELLAEVLDLRERVTSLENLIGDMHKLTAGWSK